MKLIIDIPEEVVKAIQNGKDYRYDIHTAIAQGIPYEERQQDEWFNCLSNGLLKARHGDYVVYNVNYLLDHLAREVWLLNSDIRIKTYRESEDND